jgi:hypothetical protein
MGDTLGTNGKAATHDVAPQGMAHPLSQRRSPLMPSPIEPRLSRPLVLVLAGLILVYAGAGPALEGRGAPSPHEADPAQVRHSAPANPSPAVKPLPAPVEEMREAILAAANSGRIEDLTVPLDWNELKPDVAAKAVEDPIAHWKQISGDGEGLEILAVLANILHMRPAELPLGKDLENNIIYVWPYLAEAKLDELTPAEEVDLLRLVSPEEAKAMRKAKKWTWWRLSIGADGAWHSFKKAE